MIPFLSTLSPLCIILIHSTPQFFGLFQISQVAGNLIAAFVLPPKDPAHPEKLRGPARKLFIIFSSIAVVAVVSFLALRSPPRSSSSSSSSSSGAKKGAGGVLQRFLGIFRMFAKRRFQFMILAIVYSGLSQAYFAGNFTKLVGDSKRVGYTMACFGAVDALSSVAMGRILDRFGRRLVLFISMFFILVTTGTICLVPESFFSQHLWICILCGVLAGISDAGFNTLLTATTGVLFEDDPENAFGGTQSYHFLDKSHKTAFQEGYTPEVRTKREMDSHLSISISLTHTHAHLLFAFIIPHTNVSMHWVPSTLGNWRSTYAHSFQARPGHHQCCQLRPRYGDLHRYSSTRHFPHFGHRLFLLHGTPQPTTSEAVQGRKRLHLLSQQKTGIMPASLLNGIPLNSEIGYVSVMVDQGTVLSHSCNLSTLSRSAAPPESTNHSPALPLDL